MGAALVGDVADVVGACVGEAVADVSGGGTDVVCAGVWIVFDDEFGVDVEAGETDGAGEDEDVFVGDEVAVLEVEIEEVGPGRHFAIEAVAEVFVVGEDVGWVHVFFKCRVIGDQ